MSLFYPDYEKPGPGVDPNEPRKKGFARLAELMDQDFFHFLNAGLLALVSLAPLAVGVLFAVRTQAFLPMILAGILGGIFAAPQVTALCDTILRSLRDEGGYWWLNYQQAWRKNLKSSLMPGVLFGTLFSAQIFAWSSMEIPEAGHLVLLILGMLLSAEIAIYVFAQIPLMELPLFGMLRNAILLIFGHVIHSVAAASAVILYIMLMWHFFPYSLPILLLGGAWFPTLLALLIIYSDLDEAFGIEARLETLREGKKEQDEEAF